MSLPLLAIILSRKIEAKIVINQKTEVKAEKTRRLKSCSLGPAWRKVRQVVEVRFRCLGQKARINCPNGRQVCVCCMHAVAP